MHGWALLGLFALGPAEDESADTAIAESAMAALGCPAEARTASGCAVCPAALHPEADPSAERPRQRRLRVDTFATHGPGVLLEYAGCSSRAEGDHTVVLLRCEAEACSVVETWGYNDEGHCHLPRNSEGEAFPLCTSFGGSQGCYGADATVVGGAEALEGWPQGATDCEDVPLEVARVADLDGDGDDDLVLASGSRTWRAVQRARRFVALQCRSPAAC